MTLARIFIIFIDWHHQGSILTGCPLITVFYRVFFDNLHHVFYEPVEKASISLMGSLCLDEASLR